MQGSTGFSFTGVLRGDCNSNKGGPTLDFTVAPDESKATGTLNFFGSNLYKPLWVSVNCTFDLPYSAYM